MVLLPKADQQSKGGRWVKYHALFHSVKKNKKETPNYLGDNPGCVFFGKPGFELSNAWPKKTNGAGQTL
jgi:hypothetical protein